MIQSSRYSHWNKSSTTVALTVFWLCHLYTADRLLIIIWAILTVNQLVSFELSDVNAKAQLPYWQLVPKWYPRFSAPYLGRVRFYLSSSMLPYSLLTVTQLVRLFWSVCFGCSCLDLLFRNSGLATSRLTLFCWHVLPVIDPLGPTCVEQWSDDRHKLTGSWHSDMIVLNSEVMTSSVN